MSYCHEKGLFCEFARAGGYCTSTGCNKLATVTYEIRTMTPATNADHIRSMTDEELAELLLDGCRGSKCEDQPENEWGSVNCFQCRTEWLKQPYKE